MNGAPDESLPATDWSTAGVIARRERFYAATQRKFVPFREPIVFRRGQGQYLWDESGRRYTDLLGMNLCVSVGHAHPRVVAAISAQAADLMHCTTMFYHPVPAHYAEELAATMPAGEDWAVHFTSSGSEAIDLALAMARVHTGNGEILALRNGYHGATAGAQSVTGIAGFRQRGPQAGPVAFVAEPNAYRGAFGAGVTPYVEEIRRTVEAASSGRIAGFLVEPVQGYGGIVPMPAGYLPAAFAEVRAAGGLCIVDEVQAGVARTGAAFWSFAAHGVVPDIVVAAKGIGNGIPLGAVIARRAIAESMADKFLFHTYGANPMACAAGRAVLAVIRDEQLQENAARVGAALKSRLEALALRFGSIGDVRGVGLMLALEFVASRESRTPAPEMAGKVFEAMRVNGLIASRSGPGRNVIRFCPPLCLTMDDVAEVDHGLQRSLEAAGA